MVQITQMHETLCTYLYIYCYQGLRIDGLGYRILYSFFVVLKERPLFPFLFGCPNTLGFETLWSLK